MKQNTFTNIKSLLKEQKINVNINEFADFMTHYNYNGWIYPNAVHENFNINIENVYRILEILTKKSYVQSYLQITCPNCKKNSYYMNIGDIPKKTKCKNCNFDLEQVLNHAMVVYRMS